MPRIHWAAPTALLLSLVVGTAFAIGHHVFYASLNHRPASDSVDYDVLGMHVSSQQFNTAIGTAFAFMVRACLMFSVSVAYFQILMWAVARPGADGIELSHLDILTSALGDLISLGSLKAWWRRPWIWLLVVVAWYENGLAPHV